MADDRPQGDAALQLEAGAPVALSVQGSATEATSSLAELIERLGQGAPRFDERFARDLARALHDQAGRLRIPAVERLELRDVVATFYMDRRLRLVVTGNLPEARGALSVTWDEADFPALAVTLLREPVAEPYTFATLDFSARGRGATLTEPAGPLPAGQRVTLRALATIGGRVEYRVRALGLERSVAPEGLELDPEAAPT